MPATFRATVVARRPETVVHLEGDLDLASAGELVAVVQEELRSGASHLAIDLRDLAFIDSSGLGAIVRLQEEASGHGAGLVVRNPSVLATRAFEITGAGSVLDVRVG